MLYLLVYGEVGIDLFCWVITNLFARAANRDIFMKDISLNFICLACNVGGGGRHAAIMKRTFSKK
jgi:hypothetical protein